MYSIVYEKSIPARYFVSSTPEDITAIVSRMRIEDMGVDALAASAREQLVTKCGAQLRHALALKFGWHFDVMCWEC